MTIKMAIRCAAPDSRPISSSEHGHPVFDTPRLKWRVSDGRHVFTAVVRKLGSKNERASCDLAVEGCDHVTHIDRPRGARWSRLSLHWKFAGYAGIEAAFGHLKAQRGFSLPNKLIVRSRHSDRARENPSANSSHHIHYCCEARAEIWQFGLRSRFGARRGAASTVCGDACQPRTGSTYVSNLFLYFRVESWPSRRYD
jgi:hypothetical protein